MLEKKYKNKYWIQIVFLAAVAVFLQTGEAFAQDIRTIQSRFEQYRKEDLQEKLFVHTDKDFYLAGELMWLKVYDVDGASNTPFDFSKVAYVELLNTENEPVVQTKVSLDSTAGGSIRIPRSIATGNYRLRAYTAWMKNFSPDYFFKKRITIINTGQPGGGVTSDKEAKYAIRFMPEGGNLVAGLKSDVGFRAVDEDGRGIDFKGVLLNAENDTILTFSPFKFGIGRFTFTPSGNTRYKAVLHIPDGTTIEESLPEVNKTGYVMHLQREGGEIKILVSTNLTEAKNVNLLVHTRGDIKVAEVLSLENGRASYVLNESVLDEGISAFTLFDHMLKPVCERVFFKEVDRKLSIKIDAGQKVYRPREKISLSLKTENGNQLPEAANLSVAVYRLDALQQLSPDNILNYLWLSAELRGTIQDPEYYFGDGGDVEKALDNLMLTQGWRRFNWGDVMKDKKPVITFAPETRGQAIRARVMNKSGVPAAGVLTYLGIPGKYNRIRGSMSDERGLVYFNPSDLYNKHEIVLETNTQSSDSIYHIALQTPFSDKFADKDIPRFTFDKTEANLLEMHNLWNQVENAYHRVMLDSLKPLYHDSASFYGKPYKIYHLEDYTRYTTMEEVMREYVMEVAVRKRGGRYHFQTMNALFNYDKTASAMLFQDDPLVLLDGVPVFNIDSVMTVDPLKIEKIEVVAGRYFWGPIVTDGIVSYTSYKGDMANFKLNPHALVMDYEGLQQQREYYTPVYDTDESSSRVPDFRQLLYWNPLLTSDQNGHAACSFYTSDIPGKYVVVVNGITSGGRAGYGVNYFEVKTDQ